jgi:hypothetical protein
MRITNPQKTQLRKLITDFGLTDDQFDYGGQDDIFQVKFKNNFFTFHIKMVEPDVYQNTITYVNNKNAQVQRQNWQNTVLQFRHWTSGISEDVKATPKEFKKANNEFPIEILKYSKQFVEIYKQALTAETNGLTEICGLGYRKAFEFLLKDFLLKKNPKTEHEKIKNMMLSPCINQYVTSDEIKLVSHRVLWLGNDQAHYLKKWKGKTLTDLKYLIDLTIKWILIKDELGKVEKSMPNGK